jgi:hypothetical protein
MKPRTVLVALVAAYPLSHAAAQTTPRSTDEARMAASLPGSADDHLAMAQSYEQKAQEWRKEAAFHRDMAAAYKTSHPDSKGGVPNAEAVKMEKHCMAIVHDAEKLAAEAEWSARYHRERAKELQGGK